MGLKHILMEPVLHQGVLACLQDKEGTALAMNTVNQVSKDTEAACACEHLL